MLERLAVVFAGGCVGGYTRYAVTQAWSTPTYGFPWPTFAVNVVGAFVLGVVVVLASRSEKSLRMRLLVGTGFCGALTTFGSVVVAVDELLAHHHVTTALVYLVATSVAALLLVAVAVELTRIAVARW